MPKKAKPPLTERQRKQLALVFDYVPRWRAAAFLGVAECTISRWLAGKGAPADFEAFVAAVDAANRAQFHNGKSAIDRFRFACLEDTTTTDAESHANQQEGDSV